MVVSQRVFLHPAPHTGGGARLIDDASVRGGGFGGLLLPQAVNGGGALGGRQARVFRD